MTSRSCLALVTILLVAPAAAQGPLTPPGAPGPTMRTLDQVEPRTPISTGGFAISTPGSYYLTGNVTVSTANGITISADDVTLDLNGFAITSTSASAVGAGVSISGLRRNVLVRNGVIRGQTTFSAGTFAQAGFFTGVSVSNASSSGLRVVDVRVSGVGSFGIDLGLVSADPRNAVERCSVSVCGGSGIRAANVRDCEADTTSGDGIVAQNVSRSFGQSVGTATSADGIVGFATVSHCHGIAIAGSGISGSGEVVASTGETRPAPAFPARPSTRAGAPAPPASAFSRPRWPAIAKA